MVFALLSDVLVLVFFLPNLTVIIKHFPNSWNLPEVAIS